MDDRSIFSSFLNSIFRPFFYSYQSNPLDQNIGQETDDPSNQGNEPTHSPRDSLLKPNHRSERPQTSDGIEGGPLYPHCPAEKDIFGHHHDRYHGNEDPFFNDAFPPNFHNGDFNSLFGLIDKMFEGSFSFHPNFFEESFDFPSFPDMPNQPSLPSFPDSLPGGGFQRPSKEKKDTDIDDSSHKEIVSLLKEPNSKALTPAQPSTTSRFHSTSIVRIRRPDGVIEETRKYRDSDGREEVEVITREPGGENEGPNFLGPNVGPNFPDPNGGPNFPGSNEEPYFTDPSSTDKFSFRDIFKHFPFRIF